MLLKGNWEGTEVGVKQFQSDMQPNDRQDAFLYKMYQFNIDDNLLIQNYEACTRTRYLKLKHRHPNLRVFSSENKETKQKMVYVETLWHKYQVQRNRKLPDHFCP